MDSPAHTTPTPWRVEGKTASPYGNHKSCQAVLLALIAPVGWCIHHKISHWLGEWNVLECSSLEPCAMENESIHQMSHIELN